LETGRLFYSHGGRKRGGESRGKRKNSRDVRVEGRVTGKEKEVSCEGNYAHQTEKISER